MNKIFYFTIAQSNSTLNEYLSHWRVAPNLSNQNFHNKLIRSLSLSHDVEVFSVRPINSNFNLKTLQKATKIENNITWNYIELHNNRFDKLLNHNKRINSIDIKVNHGDVVFVDTLNMSLLKAAIKFGKKWNLKIIGLCTDNPNNISFTNDSYKSKLLYLGRTLDGFICLTNKINELYNHSKPFVVIDGITEDIEPKSEMQIDGQYIYFGGSLMRRYGVYNLIDAFVNLDLKDIKLVICGHHEEAEFKSYIAQKPNILYLGALFYNDLVAVEKGAILAVNPRGIDPQIDEYSIPSKTLEYLANGVLTVTVDNAILRNHYEDSIIWTKSGDTKDLKEAIKHALDLSKEEKDKYIRNAKKDIQHWTSLESINKIIDTKLIL